MVNDKINYYVNEYHKLSEATSYELYFAYKKVLHKIELAEISADMIRLTTESQKNGGTEENRKYILLWRQKEWGVREEGKLFQKWFLFFATRIL